MEQNTPALRVEQNVNELSRRLRTLYESIPAEADRLLLGYLVDCASEVDNTVAAASVLWTGVVAPNDEG